MIRRAVSRSARSLRSINQPPPLLRPAAKPSPAADSDAELRTGVDHHVERHKEAAMLYSHLADEFDKVRNEVERVLDTFRDAASPPEGLCASVDWLMEQRPVIIESNEQLHRKIQELREGLPDVSHLVEMFQALEKTSMHLGEHVDVLQQGLVTLCTEFVEMFPDIDEIPEDTLDDEIPEEHLNRTSLKQPPNQHPLLSGSWWSPRLILATIPLTIAPSLALRSRYPGLATPLLPMEPRRPRQLHRSQYCAVNSIVLVPNPFFPLWN
jgi:hypothetical protein